MAGIIDKIHKIAKLLDFLPDHQPGYDKQKLSAWLENQEDAVTYRQLQRDLEDLEKIGWVAREQDLNGKKGDFWICTYQGTRILDKQDMSLERAFALQLIQHKLQHLAPESILKALKTEFHLSSEKLRLHGQSERNWLGKMGEVPPFLRTPSLKEGVFAHVSEALLENKWIEIDYVNKTGERRVRRVMPLGMASIDGLYYMIGRYPHDSETRQFRMDRIFSAEMTDEPFSYPDDFRLVDYLDQGFFNYPCGEKIQLVARIGSGVERHLDGRKLASDQKIIRIDDDWSRLTVTVQDSLRLQWWILRFGQQIVIEEPKALRNLIAGHVLGLAREYADCNIDQS